MIDIRRFFEKSQRSNFIVCWEEEGGRAYVAKNFVHKV